jgi:branched-chain amino acid transport system ATP-binding protein
MSEVLLQGTGVETFYGKIQALKGIDFEVRKGEIATVIGSNGAGKSTLMMTICGTPRARAGRIVFDGTEITQMPTHEIIHLGIAQSPEGRRIFPRMSVFENLQMGATVNNLTNFTEDLPKVFQLFPRLEERQGQRAGTLSGGEQQMLAIGRALMAKPRILLLDEPSLGLAPIIVDQVLDAVKTLRQDGTTILLVEQMVERALEIADYGYILQNGRIIGHGDPASLAKGDAIHRAYLGGASAPLV